MNGWLAPDHHLIATLCSRADVPKLPKPYAIQTWWSYEQEDPATVYSTDQLIKDYAHRAGFTMQRYVFETAHCKRNIFQLYYQGLQK